MVVVATIVAMPLCYIVSTMKIVARASQYVYVLHVCSYSYNKNETKELWFGLINWEFDFMLADLFMTLFAKPIQIITYTAIQFLAQESWWNVTFTATFNKLRITSQSYLSVIKEGYHVTKWRQQQPFCDWREGVKVLRASEGKTRRVPMSFARTRTRDAVYGLCRVSENHNNKKIMHPGCVLIWPDYKTWIFHR